MMEIPIDHDESFHKLFIDFLDLGENYQNEMKAQEFAFKLATMVAYMTFDIAPSTKEAITQLMHAACEGMEWALIEQQKRLKGE